VNTGLLALFCLLQAADVYTTLTVLKQGGRELNPVLSKLFAKFDPLAVMVGIKLAGVWALWYVNLWWLTLAACCVYAYVVNQNYGVMTRGR
jgi:hypothetical protein